MIKCTAYRFLKLHTGSFISEQENTATAYIPSSLSFIFWILLLATSDNVIINLIRLFASQTLQVSRLCENDMLQRQNDWTKTFSRFLNSATRANSEKLKLMNETNRLKMARINIKNENNLCKITIKLTRMR